MAPRLKSADFYFAPSAGGISNGLVESEVDPEVQRCVMGRLCH